MIGTRTVMRLAMLGAAAAAAAAGFGFAAVPPKPAADTPAAVAKAASSKPAPETRTITGTVVGPDGQLLAGVAVNTLKKGDFEKPTVQELATTDAAGTFTATVEALPSGRPDLRMLVAVKAGFGPDWIKLSDVAADTVAMKLVEDLPVTGRVTDLEGRPVAGMTVRVQGVAAGDLARVWEMWPRSPYQALHSADKSLWAPVLGGLPEFVTADPDGKFEIRGAGRGRLLNLKFEGPGLETAGCRVVTDPAFDPKKIEQPSEKTMLGGSFQPGPALYGPTFTHAGKPAQPVTGTVTDAATGKPIAGVQVDGQTGGPHWYENYVTNKTDATGRFVLGGVAKADDVRLTVFPSAKQPYFHYTTTLTGKPGLTAITADFKLTRGVLLKGRVVEKGTGTPVVGAGIHYTALADNKHYANLMKGKRGENGMGYSSDSDGRFEFVVLPGAGIVMAQGETRGATIKVPYTQARITKEDLPRADLAHLENLGEAFSAADGHIIDLYGQSGYRIIEPKLTDATAEVEIAFDRGRSVSGRVVDAAGKPAVGVTAYKLTACYPSPQRLMDGTFTAIALDPDHPRTLLFVDAEKKLSATVTLTGNEKDPTLTLQPWGKLTGRLLEADGTPVAGARVSTYPKNTIRYAAYMAVLRDRKATTDADGKFTLDVPGGPAEYILGYSLKNKSLDTGFRPTAPGHIVKPGGTTAAGDATVKGE